MKANLSSLLRAEKAIQKVLLFAVCSILHLGFPALGQTVTKQLYLSDPTQALDRVDPVATADLTTTQTTSLTPTCQYLYALRGGSRTDFWRYDIGANSWTAMASTPGTIAQGGALATNGTLIYALRGGGTNFWSYNPGTNLWTVLAITPAAVSSGASLIHVNGVLYAFQGGSTPTFWKYIIATDTWSVLASAPASSNVDWGGALTTDGTDIYALRGNGSSAFWKYTIATDTWSVLAPLSMAIDAGGSLSFDGISIYALRGGSFNSFYKYDIGTNSWSGLANTTSPVFKGGALVSDDQNTYAIRGNSANNFWRFNAGSWTSLTNVPANTDSGAAIIKFGSVSKSTVFTQLPKLCSGLTIKAGTVKVTTYVSTVYGTMPVNPTITASLKYGAATIITLSNPVYNSGTGTLTWTGTLAADVNIPSAQAISLTVATSQAGVSFTIDYDSQSKPSKIDFSVSTYITINSVSVYTAAFPFGAILKNGNGGPNYYIRAVVSSPFGFSDITGLDIAIPSMGVAVTATPVFSFGCTRTYEYKWPTLASYSGTHTITATAKEGYENTVTHSKSTDFSFCANCPPTANLDNATVPGGEAVYIDALANDTDPNNNIDAGSITIIKDPQNGSAILDSNKIVYVPNGSYDGNDTLIYQVCDFSTPMPLCDTAWVIVKVLPVVFNVCNDAVKSKTYYLPYAEDDANTALKKSSSSGLPSNNIRTIISLKVSYPGMTIVWDHWEDGYETNILNPLQATTQVWGDGNIYNGFPPGYPTDIIPAGGSIILDNTMPTPRVTTSIYYDGKDKIYSSGQIAVTQVCGEPSIIAVQCMKTNVAAFPTEYGKSFTVPVGQDLPSRDFKYTALFIRAAQNNTNIDLDRDNDGIFETSITLNEGEVKLVDDGLPPAGVSLYAGATIVSNKPIGVDAHFSGVDGYSSREVPIFPATWYSDVYYSPVPTTGPATAPHDTAVVMLYNSLSRDIDVKWTTSGVPSSGVITLQGKSAERFAMPLSSTAAYKFENLDGESFVAIEIADSYSPGTGANDGSTTDWGFNLISESRLTDFASVAWAPGATNNSRNDNPIWVTPTANTTVYVKYDGDVINGPLVSPCGIKYDVSLPLNALTHTRIKDPNDGNQSGIAVYTCDGVKIAAVYGEDPSTALAGSPSWDVGSTMQPSCKQKLIFANNDYAVTLTSTPVTIDILKNDAGFLAVIDPASVTTKGLLPPKNGIVTINGNGTVIYTPNTGFIGVDTFQYSVCSTPSPVICATATVFVTVSGCPTPAGMNIVSGQVFLDKNQDGVNNDGSIGFSPSKVYLYSDGNCSGLIDPNELTDSAVVDGTGRYQFIKLPEKTIADNFDLSAGVSSCASGNDGTVGWASTWSDAGDASVGFCVSPVQADTDVEIVQDSTFGFALRLDDLTKSAIRQVNIQNALKAFLSFSFRKSTTSLIGGENILVQLSSDGSTYNTVYTIFGDGIANSNYIDVANINISAYNTTNKTYIRFITNSRVDEGDNVFIDNVSVKFLLYDQCYIVKADAASLPSNAAFTSGTTSTFKFTSAATCLGPFDFGVRRVSTYAVNDENSTWQDVNVSGVVAINDFDQEGSSQAFGSFLNPTGFATIASGAVISGKDKTGANVANAGTITFNAAGNYTFDPSPSFIGTSTVPYRLCDNGSPTACDTAYLAITVDPLPSASNVVIANNDEDISYGSTITGNLFVNDRDPKNYSFTATLFSFDTNGDGIPDVSTIPGTVTVAGIDMYAKPVTNAGKLTISANGTYTYVPAAGFAGSVDATYTISNTAGSVTTAALHIDVLGDINGVQNDPPFAGDDFDFTTINQPVTGSFISNDRDPNSDSLSLSGITIVAASAGNAIGSTIATTKGGSVQFYSNGTYTYTPPTGYIGPDLVTYSICDVAVTTPKPLCANAILHLLIAPGITISGKVWDDADGNVIDAGASEPETNVGGSLYVNLVDNLGYVVTAVAVANNGTYSFTNTAPGTNYSLVLSTTQGLPGKPAPAAALPAGWVNTGETRNGTIDNGASGVIDNRAFGFTNTVNFDFGIEQLPNSDDYDTKIPTPVIGQFITLNGGANPPIFSGRDPEDCVGSCTLNSRSVLIDAVPLNADLFYNGVLVTSGQLITNFDPALLKLQITAVTIGSINTSFNYSFVDVAGKKDPTPGVYSLNWFSVLPVTGLNLAANLAGNAVALSWKTITEINSAYFEIERSIDSRHYVKIGSNVKAAGNSNLELQYQLADNIRDITSAIVYYRVKLTDVNGKIAYSNVAVVKIPANGEIKAAPNPFVSSITITVAVEQNTSIAIRMMDVSGRLIMSNTHKLSKEMPQVTIRDLNGLTRGVYLVEVTDIQSGKKRTFKLEKAN
jgi:hypothetical protein